MWVRDVKLVTLRMQLSVRSSFSSDSHPSRFSTISILFNAKLRYSKYFRRRTFSTKLIAKTGYKREILREKFICSCAEYSFRCHNLFLISRLLAGRLSSNWDTRSRCSQFWRCFVDEERFLRANKFLPGYDAIIVTFAFQVFFNLHLILPHCALLFCESALE